MRRLRLRVELLLLATRKYPAQVAGLVLVKAVWAVSIAACALAMRGVVDRVSAGDTRGTVLAAVLAAFGFAAIAYLGNPDVVLRAALIDLVGNLHLKTRIHADIAELEGMEHLERTDFQDRVEQVRGSWWTLMTSAFVVVDVVFGGIQLVLMLVLLGMVSPWLLLLVAFAAVPVWFDWRGQRLVAAADTSSAEAIRLQRHLFNLATEASGGKEIRVAGAGDELARLQTRAWHEAMAVRFRARAWAAACKLAGWSIFTLGFAAGLGLVVYRAAHGAGSVGDIVLAITVAVTLRDSIQQTVFRANQATSQGPVIEAYLWLRDYVTTQRERVRGDQPAPERLREGIVLQDVSFTYPGTDRPALDGVTCRIPAGSVVAVVGEYGSGKTSLVKLLLKFYQPDAGVIRVDGVDLAALETVAWRERVSAAFQDFGRFQVRFAETVGLGDLHRLDHRPSIVDAVRTADGQRLVDRLPDGLDTQLGRKFHGVELSEGQWQKTALARASMRGQPLLFVLDEPTASLDAPSEHAIFERYMERARELAARTGAITVIVSHRFSTVTGADLILVLEDGRLVESGTHQELLARDGRYAGLYGIQATAYAPSRRE
jgi:ABC-type multidrug transport system fused ATPase/permease subunit